MRVNAPETNIVMIDLEGTGRGVDELLRALARRGVLMGPFGQTRLRAVTSFEVDDAGIEHAIEVFGEVVARG